ncbi:hypothetical protein R1sor_017497 [Riccia sorocarpa]|uniref:Xyloglucan endotransglucosylase/hydrolase n=1 Tax=Riccia sorocarpa TaxID=122646 RepID=A0ABD3IAL5_9MARC
MKRSLVLLCFSALVVSVAASDFWRDFYITFGGQNVHYSGSPESGYENIQLQLDNSTGSGFQSKNPYLYGYQSMKIKLVGGNSAGTVTSFYMRSKYTNWCELDFEFLGNVSGQPYILQTNVFSEGVGNREQRIYFWFDPTADYHEYGILWNHNLILFLVDGKVIRVFHDTRDLGVPYLDYQPLYLVSSLWDGSPWCTQGGRIPIDWTQAPFTAEYTDFQIDACAIYNAPYGTQDELTACSNQVYSSWYGNEPNLALTQTQIDDLRWIKSNYIIYDYCTDLERFNYTTPPECARNWP